MHVARPRRAKRVCCKAAPPATPTYPRRGRDAPSQAGDTSKTSPPPPHVPGWNCPRAHLGSERHQPQPVPTLPLSRMASAVCTRRSSRDFLGHILFPFRLSEELFKPGLGRPAPASLSASSRILLGRKRSDSFQLSVCHAELCGPCGRGNTSSPSPFQELTRPRERGGTYKATSPSCSIKGAAPCLSAHGGACTPHGKRSPNGERQGRRELCVTHLLGDPHMARTAEAKSQSPVVC